MDKRYINANANANNYIAIQSVARSSYYPLQKGKLFIFPKYSEENAIITQNNNNIMEKKEYCNLQKIK